MVTLAELRGAVREAANPPTARSQGLSPEILRRQARRSMLGLPPAPAGFPWANVGRRHPGYGLSERELAQVEGARRAQAAHSASGVAQDGQEAAAAMEQPG